MILPDLRDFLRSLLKDFVHWALAILILGVAVGATASVYALAEGLILHPLQIPNSSDVVILSGLSTGSLPVSDPVTWWKQAHSLEYLAELQGGSVDVVFGGWRGSVVAAEVSPDFFSVFAVKAFRGRDFGPEDTLPGENRVVILSHAFWASHFEGQALPLGSIVRLNGVPYFVIGIAPKALNSLATDLWIPKCLDRTQSVGFSHSTNISVHPRWFGRLRQGATITQAHGELTVLLNRLNTTYSAKTHVGYGESIGVVSLESSLAKFYGPAVKALFAGAFLILLIAVVNCAGFLIGRATVKAKGIAIRKALGASRLDIFRGALIESAGLGLLSGVVGLLAAKTILFACQSAFPIYLARLSGRELIGPWTLVGCLSLGMLLGVLAGWLPGKRLTFVDITRVLKEDSGDLMSHRGKLSRMILVILQVALTFVLLMCATLTLETARNLFGRSKGYDLVDVLVAHLSIPDDHASKDSRSKSSEAELGKSRQNRDDGGRSTSSSISSIASTTDTEKTLLATKTQILNAAASVPGVDTVAVTDELPIESPTWGTYVGGSSINNYLTYRGRVSPDYFRALGIKFLAGRTFSSTPTNEVVVEERAASSLWPGQKPLGRTLVLTGGDQEDARVVVGVVNDTRSLEIGENLGSQFYLPSEELQVPNGNGLSVYLVLHCRLRCGDIAPALLTVLNKVGADFYVDRIAPLEDFASQAAEPLRIRTSLLTSYALMGLGLALAGVFVLSSYLSAMRRHDTGIRMALGARRAELIFQIIKEAIVATLLGLVFGTILWFSADHILRNLIYGVTALDSLTFVGVGSLIFLVMLLASYMPAFLAVIRQDPADLLRVL